MIISPAFFHQPHKLFTKTWWEHGHGLSFPSFQNQIRTYHGAVAECVQTQTGSFHIVRQHKRRPLHQKPTIVLMLLSVGGHQKVRRRKPYSSVPKTDCDRFMSKERKNYLRVLVFFEMHLSFFSSAGKTFLFSLMNNKNIAYPGMITYCVANQKSRVHQFVSCSSKMVTPYTTGFSFIKHSNHSACCIQALLFDE